MSTTLSYANTSNSRQNMYKTNMQMLTHWAELYPEKEAFIEYDAYAKRHSINCQELLRKSKAFGCYVVGIGVRKGDIVAVCMKNSFNMIVSMFGVQFAGGIPISLIQTMADGSDVIDTIRDHNCKLLIMVATEGDVSWQTLKNIQLSQETAQLLGIIYNNKFSQLLNYNLQEKTIHSVDLTNTPEVQLPYLYPEDLAAYFKTSGSTGKPKLVGHFHSGFLCTGPTNDYLAIDERSIFFCDRPFGWSAGYPAMFLVSGTTRVFADTFLSLQRNNIDFVSNIIHQEKCTHVYLPGYLVSDLLKSGQEDKFSTVKDIIFSGERVSKRYVEIQGRFCERLVVEYGSTEAAGVSAFSSHNHTEFEDGVIGKPFSGVEMKIVDKQGNVVAHGERGELYVRSIYRFVEYKGMRDKFLDTVDQANWLHTGDLVHKRDDGNFILTGRKSEKMSVGSMKIFPQEVEKVLISCPEVDTVVAVPVPDERLGDAICVCLVLSKKHAQDIEDIQKYFANIWADNALLKPKYYIAFEKFPRNATGKIDRKLLTELAASTLNLC